MFAILVYGGSRLLQSFNATEPYGDLAAEVVRQQHGRAPAHHPVLAGVAGHDDVTDVVGNAPGAHGHEARALPARLHLVQKHHLQRAVRVGGEAESLQRARLAWPALVRLSEGDISSSEDSSPTRTTRVATRKQPVHNVVHRVAQCDESVNQRTR